MNTKATLKKPCDDCSTNVEQAILYDEVQCYRSCSKWLRWSKKHERERRGNK